MKNIALRIVIIFVAIIIGLIGAECAVASLAPQATMAELQAFSFKCFTPGTYRWIKLQSNKSCPLKSRIGAFPDTMVTTNSQGLRNPEVSFAKPPDVERILFVGDSMTMGWGVDENQAYPRLVETHLHKDPAYQKMETINAGFAGAGPSGYYLYLKLFGMQLDPDVVVVGLYLLNDITSRRDIEWVTTDADGLPTKVQSKSTEIDSSGQMIRRATPMQYRIPYLRQSHLFILITNILFPQTRIQKEYDPVVTPLLCLFKENCHDMDREKTEIQMLILGMENIVKSRGKKLLLVLIPAEFQVYPEVAKDKYGIAVPLTASQSALPNTELMTFCHDHDIGCLDLLPAFRSYTGPYPWWDKDDHWNPYGHIIATQTISEALKGL